MVETEVAGEFNFEAIMAEDARDEEIRRRRDAEFDEMYFE